MPDLYYLCTDEYGNAHYVAEVTWHGYRCDWTVWAVKCWTLANIPELDRKSDDEIAECWSLPIAEREHARIFLHGEVKWDGCSNWYFDEQDDCMLHFCSTTDAERVGLLLKEIYQLSGRVFRQKHPGLWKAVDVTEARPADA